ncbi:hypothetical protein L596_020418 [Steinernema carpocapsae]|uniref:Uncharacterized protein n=1 Tax=Steinernema carpocapsae TaxID=34508 RepID=A0A4U5MU54_STECR|nr:hypothetical protein L596_020418 [Steinernema carpocapsae]
MTSSPVWSLLFVYLIRPTSLYKTTQMILLTTISFCLLFVSYPIFEDVADFFVPAFLQVNSMAIMLESV